MVDVLLLSQLHDETKAALLTPVQRHELQQQLCSQFADARLVLLVLEPSWSLMAYIPAWRQWYTFGDDGARHDLMLERLDTLGLVPGDGASRIRFGELSPGDPLVVIFTQFILLRGLDLLNQHDSWPFLQHLEQSLPVVKTLLQEFPQQLENLVNCIEK
jgi:hypothetical protein